MLSPFIRVALIVLALVIAPAGFAQDSAAPAAPEAGAESDVPDRIREMRQALEARNTNAAAPDVVSPDLLGEDGAASMQAAFKAYYDYRVQGFNHRQSVFEWQLLSSKFIFLMVILIVLAGLYFSWMQFHAALKNAASGALDKETSLEASPSGIKVSSPVLGVIILALSLAFFYLYLVHVYPIEELF